MFFSRLFSNVVEQGHRTGCSSQGFSLFLKVRSWKYESYAKTSPLRRVRTPEILHANEF